MALALSNHLHQLPPFWLKIIFTCLPAVHDNGVSLVGASHRVMQSITVALLS